MSSQGINIDVHLRMEKGMYARLVDRAQEVGAPLSAVVRDAVVQYFANIPEQPDQDASISNPDDPIWEIPNLSSTYGDLATHNPTYPRMETDSEGREVEN
jgi:hypothetical protein